MNTATAQITPIKKTNALEDAILHAQNSLNLIRTRQHCDAISDNVQERIQDMQLVTTQCFTLLNILERDICQNDYRLDSENDLHDAEQGILDIAKGIQCEFDNLETE